MSDTDGSHIPVLLKEAVAAVSAHPNGIYVDGTFGAGGHSRAILTSLPDARVVGIDRDLDAKDRARALKDEFGDRFRFVHGSYADLENVLNASGIDSVSGVLLDLGVSSFQFDQADRGFSFRFDGPLDMRFDQSQGQTAAELLATLDERAIADLIWTFGEERKSRQIAKAVVAQRERAPIKTTFDLVRLVEPVVRRNRKGPHPATRTFQALRIAVNGELDALVSVLPQIVHRLEPGGRLAVISFHSLEDRIVKQFIAEQAAPCICPPEQPICTCGKTPTLQRIGSKTRPTEDEQNDNSRSRSAILRIAERT